MSIEPGIGNLLHANVDALVNTVNTEGVMGKGLALQFKKAFPESFIDYERACRAGEVRIGQMHVVQRLVPPHFIINFPTKATWRQPSRIAYVEDGLVDLLAVIRRLNIVSIAVPPLGCGNGGLDWSQVRPLIERAFAQLPDVRVVLFAPTGAPEPAGVIDRRNPPKMTAGRAAVVALMDRYASTGFDYRLSNLEVQKLAYFLQVAGEPLRLDFFAHLYGPYADNLRKALRNMEGHQIEGIGAGDNRPETALKLLPGAVAAAEVFLSDKPETIARLNRVAQLIDGFETPFGMELLATVHWVMRDESVAGDAELAVQRVHAWSASKKSRMKDSQIRVTWRRLRELGWVAAGDE